MSYAGYRLHCEKKRVVCNITTRVYYLLTRDKKINQPRQSFTQNVKATNDTRP